MTSADVLSLLSSWLQVTEFVQALLGGEEHAKCFKKEVGNVQVYVCFMLLDPEGPCFHFLP